MAKCISFVVLLYSISIYLYHRKYMKNQMKI